MDDLKYFKGFIKVIIGIIGTFFFEEVVRQSVCTDLAYLGLGDFDTGGLGGLVLTFLGIPLAIMSAFFPILLWSGINTITDNFGGRKNVFIFGRTIIIMVIVMGIIAMLIGCMFVWSKSAR